MDLKDLRLCLSRAQTCPLLQLGERFLGLRYGVVQAFFLGNGFLLF